MIDLRSDTVTKPTPAMFQAMAEAELGDDVYEEDPTVRQLEEEGAELVGKEKALFVPSGTMGNQVAVMAYTFRGDEVIVDADSHVASYEVGGPAMLAGVQLRTVESLLEGDTVQRFAARLRPENIHFPPVRLLCLENTFNQGGGLVLPPSKMESAYRMAESEGIAVHLDGARIFNAATACHADVKEFTRWCDSVMFCLSKGLAAPVGSLLAGKASFIEAARRYRKALGGGMRQAGILAAAGRIALQLRERLEEDHHNALLLAEGLRYLSGIDIDMDRVQTNMVQVKLIDERLQAPRFIQELENRGVMVNPSRNGTIRLVTHIDVTRKEVEEAREIITDTVRSLT